MTKILEQIMELHNDPKKVIVDGHFTDSQITVPILGQYVKEDAQGWFLKDENGTYLAYVAKHSNTMADRDGIQNLKGILTELWVRYTDKDYNSVIDEGFRC